MCQMPLPWKLSRGDTCNPGMRPRWPFSHVSTKDCDQHNHHLRCTPNSRVTVLKCAEGQVRPAPSGKKICGDGGTDSRLCCRLPLARTCSHRQAGTAGDRGLHSECGLAHSISDSNLCPQHLRTQSVTSITPCLPSCVIISLDMSQGCSEKFQTA